jgi:DNA replication protein DnaC
MNEIKRAGEVLSGFKYSPPEELPEKEYKCPKHGKYKGIPTRYFKMFGDNFVADPECPQCEAERALEAEKREAEEIERKRIKRLENMNIRQRYWYTDFSTCEVSTPELKRHLETAKRFAESPDGKLVMLGDNGTGKTHLAVSILRKTGGIIYTAYAIGVRLRQSYSGGSKEWEVLEELCETPILVIDEIGRTKGSSSELDWISYVINTRHENMLPLILISNRHMKKDCPEGKDGCDKDLERFFDNDVISRIIEDGILMKFTGTDYRHKNRAAWKAER